MGASSKKVMDHLTKRKGLKLRITLENQGSSSGESRGQYRTAAQRKGRGGQRMQHQVIQGRFEKKKNCCS